MTIQGISFDGWMIHPDYRGPVPLVRSPKMEDISKLFDEKVKDKSK